MKYVIAILFPPLGMLLAGVLLVPGLCHLSAYWSQLVSGIKAPADFRRNGASAFSAYWSQRVFGVMEPVVGSTGISD